MGAQVIPFILCPAHNETFGSERRFENTGNGEHLKPFNLMKTELVHFLDSKNCYSRSNPDNVNNALSLLGVSPQVLFVEFYHSYEGPFGSEFIGFTLSDIIHGGDSSIVEATMFFRERHGFLKEHLVISDMCGYAVLVYDCVTDGVYNVDFEGGADRLKRRTLVPQWPSFEAFLDFYFLGVE